MLSFLMIAGTSLETPQRLLEISTRPWLYLLSKKYSKSITKIKDIPVSEFDDMAARGFEWVWFMGVWQLGDAGLQHDLTDPSLINSYNNVLPGWTNDDAIGSPYAVVSYTVNTQIGTEEDLKWLREQLKQRGMKLMLDFVPNHSAMDAPEVSSSPSFYVHCDPKIENPDPKKYMPNRMAFGCAAWCDAWTDVAQFNYMDEEFRRNRIEILKKIAGLCDGMRCDMAYICLNDAFWNYWQNDLIANGYKKLSTEFWADAIAAVKAEYPSCVFMAESYGDDILETLHNCGFDYTYDKSPLDALKNNNVDQFKNLISQKDLKYKQHLAHFIENHDEERAMEIFGDNYQKTDCAAVALLTLPGLRFFFQDQWFGYSRKLDVHLRRAISEDPNNNVVFFYNKFFEILKKHALKEGTWTWLTIDGSNTIVTWKWVNGGQHILVTANFGDGQSGGYIKCDDAPLSGKTIPVVELLSDTTYQRDPEEMRNKGLFVLLDGYQCQIFEY